MSFLFAGTLWAVGPISQSEIIFSDKPSQDNGFMFFLPLILQPDPFILDTAIWPHDGTPEEHEIALFRHEFNLDDDVEKAKLFIFADTRYEVWIDGNWEGRGPARFTKTIHEYDILDLGTLSRGTHVIAVLVQWAPNYRRSESTTPHLKAHIRGDFSEKTVIIARTDIEWSGILTNAWQVDSESVHSWDLIGPTELLDLRKLDPDWTMSGYPENNWREVREVNPQKISYSLLKIPRLDHYDSHYYDFFVRITRPFKDEVLETIKYQPRTIPALIYESVHGNLIDQGSLSPGFQVGEIVPPFPDPYIINFSASKQTTFTIETLQGANTVIGEICIDNQPLLWRAWGEERPDVYTSEKIIEQGNHALIFSNIPQKGLTFAVSTNNLNFTNFPFEQGLNAGRRLLLTNPITMEDRMVEMASSLFGLKITLAFPPAYAVIDLGRTIHGRVQARVSGAVGSIIDIGWDERLYNNSQRPLPYPGSLHPEWNQVDSWVLDGSTRYISNIDTRAGRYLLIAGWGEGPIILEDLQVLEERYPVNQVGSFDSSDPSLNTIWQIGVNSLYPNMTDGYTDTPWRERGQWWGDAYVEDHVNRVAFGDTELLKRGLSLMGNIFDETLAPGAAPNNNDLHILDYAMLWLHSLWEYNQINQDDHLIYSLQPVINSFINHLATYENPATGLLDLPQSHWSQTAYIETRSWNDRFGQSTALNALYCSSLFRAADLLQQIGEHNTASRMREKAQQLRSSIHDLLYQPEIGRYASTLYNGSLLPPSPHAQAWALAYGIVPDIEIDQVSNALIELLSDDPTSPNLDIYGMFWVIEALGKAGKLSSAIEIIKNYYGYLLDAGAVTWWEHFNSNEAYYRSYSHGWGGSPTWFLTTYLLGASAVGMGEWLLKPALENVQNASGSIPQGETVHYFAWNRTTCENADIYIKTDNAYFGRVILPSRLEISNISLNNKVVYLAGNFHENTIILSDDEISINLPGGHHHIQLTIDCTRYNNPWK